jgi:hypothetical protein
VAAALVARFFRSGAGPMLKMMGGNPAAQESHPDPDPGQHAHGEAQPALQDAQPRPVNPEATP